MVYNRCIFQDTDCPTIVRLLNYYSTKKSHQKTLRLSNIPSTATWESHDALQRTRFA